MNRIVSFVAIAGTATFLTGIIASCAPNSPSPAGECVPENCKSGVCQADGACAPVPDCKPEECVSGACLADGTCAPGCGGGKACVDGQFCDSQQCQELTFTNIMNSSKAVVVKDDASDDEDAAEILQSGLEPFFQTRMVSQNDPSVGDSSGRPLIGFGEIVFAPGGSYFHKIVGYLEKQELIKTTIVISGEDGAKGYQFKGSDGGIIGNNQSFQSNANDWDFFSVELVFEPKSGSLVVIAYGFWGSGTKAAAYYLVNEMLKNPENYTDSWYVFKWEDTEDNDKPDAGDTFTLLASQ